MTTIVVGSVRGAPGATTVSLLMASCIAGGVVAEADVEGGVLAARYGLGREPGLTTMAAARSRGPDEWRQHAQFAGGVPVLVGPDAPQHAAALWARAGDELAGALAASSARIIVDVGRVRPGAGLDHLFASAALVVVLVRPRIEDLLGLAHRLPLFSNGATVAATALVGSGPYTPEDIAGQFGLDVVGALPVDRRAAAMLDRGGTAQGLARTGLARAVRSLAEEVVGRIGVPDAGRRALMPSTQGRQLPP